MKTTPLLAGSIAVLLAACGGDTAEDDLASFETPAPPVAEEAPLADVPASFAGMSETAQLQELAQSGITGEVQLTEQDTRTEVNVTIEGAESAATMPGHIHTGTCDALGGVVQPLESVAVDESGSGSVNSTVTIDAMTVMDGQHIVVYHAPDGTPVTCAPIPAHQM